jgi:ankyrin repeat protein
MLAAAALVSFAAPAVAQMGTGYQGLDFLEAVKSRDGSKAMQLLTDNPAGLVNSRGDDGNTALIMALARRDPEWVGFLLNKGADPNLGGKGGDTPLIVAARYGFDDAIQWLLDLGAKVDATNKMGETPLIVAVQQRQIPAVRLLLRAGANPDKTDNAAGYSARNYAERDTRARDLLQLINAMKPKPATAH